MRANFYMNPLLEREVYLRGLKIPAIENMGVLEDKFDCIDLSDNEIRRIDNFPKMSRMATLLLNNNFVSKIAPKIGSSQLLHLKVLVLTNNKVASFEEIDHLSSCTELEALSLVDNPVQQKLYYRLYVVFKIPSLRVLDFQKVKKAEKEAAIHFFESEDGKAYLRTAAKEDVSSSANAPAKATPMTPAQKEYIRQLITEASSLGEIDAIESQLRDGNFVFPEHLTPLTADVEDSDKMET